MIEQYRYHSIAIVLHWCMALGMVFMVGSGLYMVNADIPKAEQFDLYQLHKASGVVMLWAIVLRLAVRLLTTQPKLPTHIPETQQRLASIGHGLLYLGLIVMPLSGWVMVSSSPFGLPTFVFVDWIKWPHIPGLERNKTVESLAKSVHWYALLALVTVLLAHISAVILHRLKHTENLLKRMWWT